MSHQIEGVLPRHVRVLQAVKDVDWPAWIHWSVPNEMAAAILDERPSYRIGTIAIARRTQEHALLFDILTCRRREVAPHQIGHVPGWRNQYQRPDARGQLRLPGDQLPHQQQCKVAAHAGADQNLRAICQ